MFYDGEDRRAWRPVDPPLAVEVRLLWAFPRRQGGGAGDVPLWVDAAGLDLRAIVPGILDGWLLTSVGTWWGRVALHTGHRDNTTAPAAILVTVVEVPTWRLRTFRARREWQHGARPFGEGRGRQCLARVSG